MVHWWSQKERGSVVSVWNVAHNVGGGLIGPLFLLGLAPVSYTHLSLAGSRPVSIFMVVDLPQPLEPRRCV